MKFINFNNKNYPSYQAEGFAAQFIFPFARKFCVGHGLDIGCSRKEWSLQGSTPIDIIFDDQYHALNLPDGTFDYIFSSHCLEHLEKWTLALDLWLSRIREGGILFLYLPDYSQEYWRPWNCDKHIHYFTSSIIIDYLKDRKMKNILYSGIDLNNSFSVVCEK